MKDDIIICSCGSVEHQVIIRVIKGEPEVYLTIHLQQYKSFWKRLWVGLKYAFGYTSRYGEWDEIILDKSHATAFRRVSDYLRKQK
jgi:hypothetical protein